MLGAVLAARACESWQESYHFHYARTNRPRRLSDDYALYRADPNGWKASIALEELAIPYETTPGAETLQSITEQAQKMLQR